MISKMQGVFSFVSIIYYPKKFNHYFCFLLDGNSFSILRNELRLFARALPWENTGSFISCSPTSDDEPFSLFFTNLHCHRPNKKRLDLNYSKQENSCDQHWPIQCRKQSFVRASKQIDAWNPDPPYKWNQHHEVVAWPSADYLVVTTTDHAYPVFFRFVG